MKKNGLNIFLLIYEHGYNYSISFLIILGLQGAEKMVKRLNEEVFEARQKVENILKEHKSKMSELGKILGLEVDVEKLVTRPNEKDLKNFRAQRAAMGELDEVKRERDEVGLRIERNKRQIQV